MSGRIELILGPMGSGKTTELMRRLRRYQLAKRGVLIIKSATDTRADSLPLVRTHDGMQSEAIVTKELIAVVDTPIIWMTDVIGIDEGQFFPDLIEGAETLVRRGKIVIVAALDGDSQRKPFGQSTDLVSRSESVVKLNAVCVDCGADASFTYRVTESDERIQIGGMDIYAPVCRACYCARSKK